MNSGEHNRARLALRLAGLLAEGIEVSPATVLFAETTYGLDPAACKNVLAGTESDEQETLQRLVFHPDRQVQVQLEPLLCQIPLAEAQAALLLDELSERLPSVVLIFPDRSRLTIPVSRETWRGFVNKLYLGRVQDPAIVSALYDALPSRLAAEALVEMRRKKMELSPAARDFLSSFLTGLKRSGRDSVELVFLLLNLLHRLPAGKKPEDYVLDEYNRQRKSLEEIGEFSRRRDRYGFEYLLMQRYRIPPESVDEVRQRLSLLGIIIGEILQLQDPAGRLSAPIDLGYFDPRQGLESLFRVLG